MSDEHIIDPEMESEGGELEALDDHLEALGADFDEADEAYEEISCETVDRVIEALADLMETIDSDAINECLEEAINNIFDLVYEDEREEPGSEAA